MTITATETNATSHSRRYGYRHLDDAASPAAISKEIGFKPRYVCFENITDRIKYEWYEGMASTDYIKTVAAGTRTLGTDSALSVNVSAGAGSGATITVAASQVLQNKQNYLTAQS